MIDTNKLRRLAQAATPHVGHACKYQDAHWLREGHVDFENADLFIASERPQEDAAFYAAVNPAAIIEILDRLEATEEDRSNFLVEMGKLCAQCDALRAAVRHEADCVESAKSEIEALRAKITEMEKQEPIRTVGGMPGTTEFTMACFHADKVPIGTKLYTLPGAKGEDK